MDFNKANEISSAQVYILVISAQISFGVLYLGTNLAKAVGHDGWICVLLAGLLISILITIELSLLKRFKNKSILDINIYLFGKFLGSFLNLFVMIKLSYTAVMCLRLFTEIISISVLDTTPGYVLAIFILIPVVYLSWYGLKYICRFASIKPALLLIIILYYFLLSKYVRLTFLLPVGEAGLVKILKNTYTPYVSYMGFELLAIIYPHIKNKDKALKSAIYANITTMLFYVITVIFVTGFFGEKMLVQLQYPIFSLARAYRAPIFERLDLFFITLWFPIMATVLLSFFFMGFYSIRKALSIEDNKYKTRILLIIYSVSIIILSRLPKDMIQIFKLFDYVGYLSTTYLIHIIICYIFSFIKKPGGKKNEKTL